METHENNTTGNTAKVPIGSLLMAHSGGYESVMLALPAEAELEILGLLVVAIPDYLVICLEWLRMDRDLELRMHGHLFEIRRTNDEILDSKQGYPMSKEGYRRTLESVATCGGPELLDRVAEDIKEYIRAEKERPDNRSVRRDARTALVNEGIVPDEYLNRA